MDLPLNHKGPTSRGEARGAIIRLESEIGRRSLYDFIKLAWPIIEPATPFCEGWHIRAICDHLEACTMGKIRRLLINMPPRHGKSSIVSVLWPVWSWIKNPSTRWLFSSYALHLSMRDSVRCRRIIESPWFAARWGGIFALTSDQNQKMRFDNSRTGYRLATSVEGSNTGEGGEFIVADDPHNASEGESDARRESVLEWWDTVMSTRGNDPRTVCKVVIMQRLHEKDLSGHLLAKEGSEWEHLCLPAEYEGKKSRTSIGWEDPRTKDGELLWPNRFGGSEIISLKRELGSYAAAGQLQQRPAPMEGGVVKRSWFRYWSDGVEGRMILGDEQTRITPWHTHRFATVDFAVSKREHADYTVCAVWGMLRDGSRRLVLLDVLRRRLEGPEIVPAIKALAVEKWKVTNIWPEPKGFQLAIVQDMVKRGLPVREMPKEWTDRDKITRLLAATPTLEQGFVYFPKHAPWLSIFESELLTFPNAEHDDQVDALAYAVAAWNKIPVFSQSEMRDLDADYDDVEPPDSCRTLSGVSKDPWGMYFPTGTPFESFPSGIPWKDM